jgi:hypothetical protein
MLRCQKEGSQRKIAIRVLLRLNATDVVCGPPSL